LGKCFFLGTALKNKETANTTLLLRVVRNCGCSQRRCCSLFFFFLFLLFKGMIAERASFREGARKGRWICAYRLRRPLQKCFKKKHSRMSQQPISDLKNRAYRGALLVKIQASNVLPNSPHPSTLPPLTSL
jgi:hypothetical protein